jgi:hypothetical protein
MAKLYNLARMTTATTGTGTITLGIAVSGYLTFALAGVADGDIVSYGINDGLNSEVGTGTYTASGTTLTRTVTASTNGNAAINLSGTAQVFITPRREDLLSVLPNNNLAGNNSGAAAPPAALTADQAVALLKTGIAATGMLQSKYVTFSYNLATASGSQSITGVGFKPSTLIVLGFVNATNTVSIGFADAGRTGAAVTWYGSNLGTGGAHPFEAFLANGAGADFATGDISSYDSDGFTISWTKNGSPTGTVTWSVLALR